MANLRCFQWLLFIVILASGPGLSFQQRSEDSPPRFNPGSRPNMMTLGSSTPVPLDIEHQLKLIEQQEEKLEQMKQRLIQQLDKFRDEYMENILSSTSSIIMSTIRPPTPTTPASDKTTTRLMEIRESYMEIEVKSPLVIINNPNDRPTPSEEFARS